MKKILTAIAAAVFIIYPSICFASYVIHLEDGREFVTDRYWEEGDQIKFKRYGGVIGIQKGLVREIEVIEEVEELPEEKAAAKPGAPATKTEADKQGASESAEKAVEVEKPKEQGEPEKELDEEKRKEEREKKTNYQRVQKALQEKYQGEQKALQEKYQAAREKLEIARKTGNKALRREAKKELKQIKNLQKELAIKLKKENNGILPPWWHSQAKPE